MSRKKGVLSAEYHNERIQRRAFKYRLKRRSDEILKVIKSYDKSQQISILDVGTADGLMLAKLNQELNLKISVGIDLSSELLKFADGTKSYFVQSDAAKLPFEDDFFDVLIACAVIEHVPDAVAMVNEFNRVLKRGGLCIITTPDPFFEYIATMIRHLKEDDHIETFDINKIRSLLISNGFEVLKLEKFMISPIGLPFEDFIEKLMKSFRCDFMLLNQLAVGKKV